MNSINEFVVFDWIWSKFLNRYWTSFHHYSSISLSSITLHCNEDTNSFFDNFIQTYFNIESNHILNWSNKKSHPLSVSIIFTFDFQSQSILRERRQTMPLVPPPRRPHWINDNRGKQGPFSSPLLSVSSVEWFGGTRISKFFFS